MAYIGKEPQVGNYQICDAISVVNGQAAYTMQRKAVDVLLHGVAHGSLLYLSLSKIEGDIKPFLCPVV